MSIAIPAFRERVRCSIPLRMAIVLFLGALSWLPIIGSVWILLNLGRVGLWLASVIVWLAQFQ